MDKVQKHVFLSGRVQGVGFRHFTRQEALRLNLNGWVRNLRDGRVEVWMEGTPENTERMMSRLQEGPRSANVTDITVKEETTGGSEYRSFQVKPTV
ncbi:MAG: acylphosphatase [Balneolaceae bacterium]